MQSNETAALRRISVSTITSARMPDTRNLGPANFGQEDVVQDISHPPSNVWLSDRAKESEKWQRCTTAMKHFGLDSEQTKSYLPWDFAGFLQQREFAIYYEKNKFCREARKKSEASKAKRNKDPAVIPFRGKEFIHKDRGSVLSVKTIWCKDSNSRYGATVWPSAAELSYNGNERISTGHPGNRSAFRRMFPRVRAWREGDDTTGRASLSDVPPLIPYYFDWVERPPSKEDIYIRAHTFTEEEASFLLSKELLAAMDDGDFVRKDGCLEQKPHQPTPCPEASK